MGDKTAGLGGSSNYEDKDAVVLDSPRNNQEDMGVGTYFSRKMDLTVSDLKTCLIGHSRKHR